MIFNRFLVRLGVVLAPFLAPKLVQNRLKIASRRFLRPYFFKNADFHADLRFPRFFHQNRPQDAAKIGPRRHQDGLEELLFRCQKLSSILVCFRLRFGCFLGAFWEPSWRQSRTKKRPKNDLRPKTAPRPPKSTPRAPQEPPVVKLPPPPAR